MEDCIFCKIASKNMEADIVSENEEFVAFNDINPRAKHHILIIPKKHIPTMNDLDESAGDDALVGRMMLVARDIAKERGLSSHKLQFNIGSAAGQTVFHIHMHLMAS